MRAKHSGRESPSSRPSIRIWSKLGSDGGVSSSARSLAHGLLASDAVDEVALVNLSSPLAVLKSVTDRTSAPYNVFWASSIRSAKAHTVLAAICRGESCLFVHTTGESLGRAGLRSPFPLLHHISQHVFPIVYSNGSKVRQALDDIRIESIEASCFTPVSSATPRRASVAREPNYGANIRCITSAYLGNKNAVEVYGLDYAIQAVRHVRSKGGEASLDIVAYGWPGEVGSISSLADLPVRPSAQYPSGHSDAFAEGWVQFVSQWAPADSITRLSAYDLLIRATSTDGDSMFVREALTAGLRVVASDVSPRPLGVELAGRDAVSIAEAINLGGLVSDGSGLGQPVIDLLLHHLRVARN